MRNVLIMGAGGRDFHDFNVVDRDDPARRGRRLHGRSDPRHRRPGAIRPRSRGGATRRASPAARARARRPHPPRTRVDEVVFAYSDVPHEQVMHRASLVLAAGADFALLGPADDAAVVQARRRGPRGAHGRGKSQTSRRVGADPPQTRACGSRSSAIRCRITTSRPSGATLQDLDDLDASIRRLEEREEDEPPVARGPDVGRGRLRARSSRRAETEAVVVIWDGGNNDFSFYAPDLVIVIVDPLRAGRRARAFIRARRVCG